MQGEEKAQSQGQSAEPDLLDSLTTETRMGQWKVGPHFHQELHRQTSLWPLVKPNWGRV